MKKLFLIMALTILCANTFAQTTTFDQVYRNNGSGASGSTWANSATHYTDYIDMVNVDSAWIVVNFPDSVVARLYVENYTSKTDGVVLTSAKIDSLVYVTDGTGVSNGYSLTGFYTQGFPIIRIKTVFSATKNDSQLTEKYKYYIKRFRHK